MKIYIDIRDGIDPGTAVERVAAVVSKGKVSKNSKRDFYCFLTRWSDGITVTVNLYRKSDCFIVYKSERYEN
jgi:hypothetical protein